VNALPGVATALRILSWTTVGLHGFPTIAVNFIYMLIMVMYMNFATDVLLVARRRTRLAGRARVGLALSWAGYAENTDQPQSTRNLMILLNGGIPCLCFVVGIAAFSRFRLDSEEHRRIRAEIDRRGGAQS
jgi:Na+/melibiose symporter-like transporter